MRVIREWTRFDYITIAQLKTVAGVKDKAAKSMANAIRDLCDRIAYEWPDDFMGGNGAAVAVVDVGVQCNGHHDIRLYIDGTGQQHMVHTHNAMPIKPGTTIYNFCNAVPGAVPDNCTILAGQDCPIVGVEAKREAAAAWWRRFRGVDCRRANAVTGDYTMRKRYFVGDVETYGNIYLDKLRIIYAPLFAGL